MRELIDISNLSFSFDDQTVLNNLQSRFYAQELSIILGRNGSGKSTLFRILSGMERNYLGKVIVEGVERKDIAIGRNAPVRIGFLPQFHFGTFPFSVTEVLLTGRAAFSKFSPSKKDKQLAEEILDSFNLSHLKEKAYTSLSGGERQLVLLCRVLLQEPDILLLDEPTNHLDLHFQVIVAEHLQRLVKAGTTVICIMHDPNLALLYGDRFFLMKNGQLCELGNLDTEQQVEELEETFNLELELVKHNNRQLIIPKLKKNGN